MAILLTCNACQTELRIRDEFQNKEILCPSCRAILTAAGEHVPDHEVFISYSNKDKTTADSVCAALEAQYIRCWIAPRDIDPGAGWGTSIIEAIENARIMVLIYSGSANLSNQVIREVERAVAHGLVLVPFRIDSAPMSKEMEYFLSRSHWLDALTPPLATHLQKLVETCRLLLLQKPEERFASLTTDRPVAQRRITKLKVPDHSVPPQTQSVPKRPNTSVLVAAMAIVAIAVGLAVWQPWKQLGKSEKKVGGTSASRPFDQQLSRGAETTPVVTRPPQVTPTVTETKTAPPKPASLPQVTTPVLTTPPQVTPTVTETKTAPPKPASLPQVTATTTTTGANLPKEMTIELGGGVKMEFVLIRPGSFMMGSDPGETNLMRMEFVQISPDSFVIKPDKGATNEKPVHKVTLTQSFYMGKFEVTQEQWEKVMGSNPSQFKGAKNPVDTVSWDDCQNFITKLKEKNPGQLFRLPTEAEWEYACRAGSTTEYSYGDNAFQLGNYAWFKGNSAEMTHPVGQKKPNAWGLYDMHGNVSECCQDLYQWTYEGAPADGSAWTQGGKSQRVVRGGSRYDDWTNLRSASRAIYNPGVRYVSLGFRVVAAVEQTETKAELPKPSPPLQVTAATTTMGANLQKEMAIELGDDVTMEFVLIRSGSFLMGSDKPGEKPVHKVTITKPFYMGKYEVTQEQWEKVMGSNPSYVKGAKNPVEQVSWDDCQEFVAKLKDKARGETFRLPTEAEWEYACRAGSKTEYCYGDDAGKLGDYAWFTDNSGKSTQPVGGKKPNAWGLYDMHGNVREWCADWHGDYTTGAVTDPIGPPSGFRRMLRGGSWDYNDAYCRSAFRLHFRPSFRTFCFGLRVVVAVR